MKRYPIAIALLLSLSLTACKKSEPSDQSGNDEPTRPAISRHEEIANAVMKNMQEFGELATSVTDEASAKAAAEKMDEISSRFVALSEELKKMDVPPAELKAKINDEMEAKNDEMEKMMGLKMDATMKALSPEAREVMLDAFQNFSRKMADVGQEFERHFKVEDDGGDAGGQ